MAKFWVSRIAIKSFYLDLKHLIASPQIPPCFHTWKLPYAVAAWNTVCWPALTHLAAAHWNATLTCNIGYSLRAMWTTQLTCPHKLWLPTVTFANCWSHPNLMPLIKFWTTYSCISGPVLVVAFRCLPKYWVRPGCGYFSAIFCPVKALEWYDPSSQESYLS